MGGRLPSLEMRTPGNQCSAVTGARCENSSIDMMAGAIMGACAGSVPVPVPLAPAIRSCSRARTASRYRFAGKFPIKGMKHWKEAPVMALRTCALGERHAVLQRPKHCLCDTAL